MRDVYTGRFAQATANPSLRLTDAMPFNAELKQAAAAYYRLHIVLHAVHAVYSPLPAFGAALAWSVAGKVESDMHRLASAPLSAIAARVHWSLTVPCGCSSFPHAGEAVHVPPSGGDSLSEEGQSAQRTCASPCWLFLCCSHLRNCAHGCRPFCACRCCCHMTQAALPFCFLNSSSATVDPLGIVGADQGKDSVDGDHALYLSGLLPDPSLPQ